MPVQDDETQEIIGFLTNPLINPDTGRILGFFVSCGAVRGGHSFLSTMDICTMGTAVHVRTIDKLSPPGELIRMRKHFDDPRTFLGQPVRVRGSRRTLGRCADIQFDTRHFAIEWLFPRGFLFFAQPVAATDIEEVTADTIWIEDPLKPVKESSVPDATDAVTNVLVPEITTTAQGRSRQVVVSSW